MRLAAALILITAAGAALAQQPYTIDASQIQVTPWTDSQIRGARVEYGSSDAVPQGTRSEHGVSYEAGADIGSSGYLNVNASGNDESPPSFTRHWGDPHENLNGE